MGADGDASPYPELRRAPRDGARPWLGPRHLRRDRARRGPGVHRLQLRRGADDPGRRRDLQLGRLRRGDGRGHGSLDPRDGRARAPHLPHDPPAGVHPPGDGPLGDRAGRSAHQPDDRRASSTTGAPTSCASCCSRSRWPSSPTLLGLPAEDLPEFHRLAVELIGVTVDWDRSVACVGQAARVLLRHRRRPARAPGRRHDLGARRRPSRTGSSSPTRRSTPSCGCCCRPGPRRPTARRRTSCSGCSPTAISSTPCWPIARSDAPGHRGGHPLGAAAADHRPRRHARRRGVRRVDPRRGQHHHQPRLGQPRRDPLAATPSSSTSSASAGRTSASPTGRTCASACTWPAWRPRS